MVRKKKSMDLGVGMRDKEAAMKDHNKRLPQMPLLVSTCPGVHNENGALELLFHASNSQEGKQRPKVEDIGTHFIRPRNMNAMHEG